MTVPAHDQAESHRYTAHYPEHGAREADPHYKDFNAYHKRTHDTATCSFADATGRHDECSVGVPLELHHAHIEFALTNGVDLASLERFYPGVSNPDEVGAWVESATNLVWLCMFHHRGHGGVHCATSSDFEASHYVKEFLA